MSFFYLRNQTLYPKLDNEDFGRSDKLSGFLKEWQIFQCFEEDPLGKRPLGRTRTRYQDNWEKYIIALNFRLKTGSMLVRIGLTGFILFARQRSTSWFDKKIIHVWISIVNSQLLSSKSWPKCWGMSSNVHHTSGYDLKRFLYFLGLKKCHQVSRCCIAAMRLGALHRVAQNTVLPTAGEVTADMEMSARSLAEYYRRAHLCDITTKY